MKRIVCIVLCLLIGGMFVASISAKRDISQQYQISHFLGLNCDKEIETDPAKRGEAVDMQNFRVTADYRLEKREGWQNLNINENMPSGKTIERVLLWWYGSLVYDNSYDFLYRISIFKSYVYSLPVYELYVSKINLYNNNVVQNSLVFTFGDEGLPSKINAFKSNGCLYIMAKGYYYKYSGLSSSQVTGTIPTTFINCSPNLSQKTQFQPINLLTLKRKIQYVADGTSNFYYFPESAYSIVSVTVNGSPTTQYDFSVYVMKFRFLEGYIPANGSNVEVTYVANHESQSELITNCTQSILYGGAEDIDLFVWGNTDHKSTVYYTYAGDVEHFGDKQYNTYADQIVTGICVQNGTMVVFTNKSIYSSITDPSTVQVLVGNEYLNKYIIGYPKKIINPSIGNKNGFNVQVINNYPTFISNDNTIWQLTTANLKDERNIQRVSDRVQKLLSKADLINGINIDWQARSEYWLVSNGTAYVWNYKNNTWYTFTNIPATSYCLIDDELYFGTSDGAIAKFDRDLTYDISKNISGVESQTEIEAYAEFPYNPFNADYLKKSVQMLSLTAGVETENDTYIRVETWTNSNKVPSKKEFYLESGKLPHEFVKSISANNFQYFKLKIISDKRDCKGTVLNYSIKYQYNGDVR